MKTLVKEKAIKIKIIVMALIMGIFLSCDNPSNAQVRHDPAPSKKSIKLAILLDTSNSMDGLIDQAKSQLWSIVNELAKAECDNIKPELRIALYEYGNDNLPSGEGFIRMVTPLTSDLDQISHDLFKLKTCGGQEYCGRVISTALKELDWSPSSKDYQVIFIAGNEPFTQGNVDFREACAEARRKGVVVNTIFCGDFNEGINTSWKSGADLTSGNYFSIEQNRKTVYIETPYDRQISLLNERLNNTYVYYGSQGRDKKMMQSREDQNAKSYGTANEVNRAVSKSSHVYKNNSWDLVDASEEKEFKIAAVPHEQLPAEMQKMNESEKTKYVEEKKEEREKIKKEINELNVKRADYIKKQNLDNEGMFDNAMISAIKKQAGTKEFQFK
jgi:hypothetical protein